MKIRSVRHLMAAAVLAGHGLAALAQQRPNEVWFFWISEGGKDFYESGPSALTRTEADAMSASIKKTYADRGRTVEVRRARTEAQFSCIFLYREKDGKLRGNYNIPSEHDKRMREFRGFGWTIENSGSCR